MGTGGFAGGGCAMLGRTVKFTVIPAQAGIYG